MFNGRRTIFLITILIFQGYVNSDLIKDGILTENSTNNNVCLVYQPYLGAVESIEGIDIKSQRFEITDDDILLLDGDVNIDFPDGILKADKAKLDRNMGLVQFKKDGSLFLKDYFFKSKEGSFNKNEQSIELYQGQAFLNDRNLILTFEKLSGNLKNKIVLNQVSMTSCADTKNGWEFIAENIELDDRSKRGYAKNVKIRVLNKTIAKLPYVPFATSNERMTGFLQPSISYSSDGLDFMIPYYKVLSNTSDITLAPRNISERGLGFEGNYRRLHGDEKNLSNFDFIYFNNDKEYKSLYPNKANSRWAFSLNDSYGKDNKFWIDIDWAKASDSLVLRDISGDITSIGGQRAQNLKQNVSINGVFGNLGIKVEHQGFQTLNPILTNGYKKSPSIEFQFFKDFKNFTLHEQLNISYFKASDIHGFYGYPQKDNKFLYSIAAPAEGSRVFSNFKITNQTSLNGINISSSLGFKSINYHIDDKTINTNSVNVPNFRLDINSLFYKKDKMTFHMLKPRLVYGYVGYEKQDMNPVFDTHDISMMNQLFNTDRFTGMDRIGDQKFYTLNLEYKKSEMNMDKISVNISKKFYMSDRRVLIDSIHIPEMNMNMNMDMDMSNMMNGMDEGPLMIMGKWMPNMNTMFMTYGSYVKDLKEFPMAGLTFKKKFEVGSFGYAKRYKKMSGDFNNVLDYSEIFADFRIRNNVSVIAKLKRDDDSGSKIESVLGLGYENCCFVFRLTASDKNLSKYLPNIESNSYMYLNDAWDNIIRIENKSRINFQFEFKGLNSSLEKINRLRNNSIFNY
tara:strand:- start:30 stop:2411 length:2382 start_codon:yes stop_codon:yes gene_type:complete